MGREKKRKRGKKPNKHGIKSSLRKFGCRCEARRKGGCEPPPGTAAPPSPPRRPRPGPVRPRTAAPTATFQLGGLGGGHDQSPPRAAGDSRAAPHPSPSSFTHPLCALCVPTPLPCRRRARRHRDTVPVLRSAAHQTLTQCPDRVPSPVIYFAFKSPAAVPVQYQILFPAWP